MTAKVIAFGQYVYVEDRADKNKPGWYATNGLIISVMDSDGLTIEACDDPADFEPYEVIVQFSEEDSETYFTDDLEWTDSYQGTWIKV